MLVWLSHALVGACVGYLLYEIVLFCRVARAACREIEAAAKAQQRYWAEEDAVEVDDADWWKRDGQKPDSQDRD